MKQTLNSIFKTIFLISLVGFIVLGIALVVVQLAAVITQNGNLAIQAKELLRLPAIRLSVLCGFSAFFHRFTKEKKPQEAS